MASSYATERLCVSDSSLRGLSKGFIGGGGRQTAGSGIRVGISGIGPRACCAFEMAKRSGVVRAERLLSVTVGCGLGA